ncbi:MAG: ribosomal protein S18-alanine N-acetyltransferase [Candidatus Faecousia sp.]|uniref:ribosomal protein S18-alanine N-acetyltransferase n=1 Tax=Faecousia sp. TaxID=2952921 RepID=UPI002A888847|nr:ribosomal protein S18-alanine N-acetyltransferase [Candidatus Faecousia sp.]
MIRPMTAADVPSVAALEKLCFSDPWSVSSIASELDNPLSLWLVWEEDGTAAAYLGVQRVPPQADVMNVAVSPALRRRGIARALFAELERRLPEIDELFLEVRASNSGAIALYRTLGFEQVGRRPNYYLDPREDALILRKELFHADPVR